MAKYTDEDIIYETPHFVLTRAGRAFVSREEGGHMRIFAKRQGIAERRDFTPQEAVEWVWLSSIAGEALERGMKTHGVNIITINFAELGNWAFKYGHDLVFHEHIFGRVEGAKHQVFPEAIQLPARETGFYDTFVPLNDEDAKAIRTEIEKLVASDKYANKAAWSFGADS
jgi:diadenosine tetraphosphate (Ap4A) HIT family hydrolase